jgi:mRNA interferase YafQ
MTCLCSFRHADRRPAAAGAFRDHVLAGQLKGYRDCHIRPGLILIYRKPDEGRLELVRLGSHTDLGL